MAAALCIAFALALPSQSAATEAPPLVSVPDPATQLAPAPAPTPPPPAPVPAPQPAPAAAPALNPWPASLVGALATALGGCLCGGLCVVPVVAVGQLTEGWGAIAMSPGVGVGALVGAALGATLPAVIWSSDYSAGDTFLIIGVPAALTALVAGSTAVAAAMVGTAAGHSTDSDGELVGAGVGVALIGGGLVTAALVSGLLFGGLSLLVYGE